MRQKGYSYIVQRARAVWVWMVSVEQGFKLFGGGELGGDELVSDEVRPRCSSPFISPDDQQGKGMGMI